MVEGSGLLSRCRRQSTVGSNPTLSANEKARPMEYEIKHLDVWSVAKVVFIIFLIIGFFISIFYVLLLASFAGMGGFGGEFGSTFPHLTGGFALLMALFMSVVIAVLYAVIASLFAVLYNIFVGWMGGIKMELESEGSLHLKEEHL